MVGVLMILGAVAVEGIMTVDCHPGVMCPIPRFHSALLLLFPAKIPPQLKFHLFTTKHSVFVIFGVKKWNFQYAKEVYAPKENTLRLTGCIDSNFFCHLTSAQLAQILKQCTKDI